MFILLYNLLIYRYLYIIYTLLSLPLPVRKQMQCNFASFLHLRRSEWMLYAFLLFRRDYVSSPVTLRLAAQDITARVFDQYNAVADFSHIFTLLFSVFFLKPRHFPNFFVILYPNIANMALSGGRWCDFCGNINKRLLLFGILLNLPHSKEPNPKE